jgi:hypothetical protein
MFYFSSFTQKKYAFKFVDSKNHKYLLHVLGSYKNVGSGD